MIVVFCIAAIVLVLRNFNGGQGVFELPNLYGLMALVYFLPQIVVQLPNGSEPEAGFDAYLAMATACLIATYFGWHLAMRESLSRRNDGVYTRSGYFRGAAASTAIALVCNLVLEFLRPSMDGIQQWYGPIVIVAFFAQLRIVSFAFSLALFFRERTMFTTTNFVLNLCMVLPSVLLYARRTDLVGAAFAYVVVRWFVKRRIPPLHITIPLFISIFVVTFAITEIRTYQYLHYVATGERLSILSPQLLTSIDFSASASNGLSTSSDIRNGMRSIAAVQSTGSYSFGAALWNRVVFQYVPATVFGPSVKESFMFDIRSLDELASEYSDYYWQTGTTPTGFATAFQDFWYAGSLYFVLMAYLTGRTFKRALSGDIFSQVLYVPLVAMALVSLTHSISYFFVSYPFFWVSMAGVKRLFRRRGLGDGNRPLCNSPTSYNSPTSRARLPDSPSTGTHIQSVGWRPSARPISRRVP
ncbi:hypothetical protein NKI41_30640 [Mesorhizobium sp. M0601]|uniref:hypothetical protein n=1 Tax=Mesorhizobium sp. M0601 TaxID=2956969 RepID=UPI00333BAABE